MRLTAGTVAAGAALYAGVAGSTYLYMKSTRAVPDEGGGSAGCSCSRRFDRLAGCYDDRIGMEERFMLYGLMRKWLLRGLKGDVLEISAGTGRNLPYYPLEALSSLTLTDTSVDMLQVAEAKYYDKLKLGYKHPEAAVKFLVSDAQQMVARDGETAKDVPLHRAVAAAWAPPAGHVAASSDSTRMSSTGASEHAAASSEQGQQQSPADGGAAAGPGSMQPSKDSSSSGSRFDSGSRASTAEGHHAHGNAYSVVSSMFGQLWRHSSSDKPSPDVSQRLPSSNPYEQERTTGSADKSSSSSTGRSSSSSSTFSTVSSKNTSTSDSSPVTSHSGMSIDIGRQLSKFLPHSFDVVVDTFGLCSHENPVLALQQAAQLCRPGGHILLLEHGRSSWAWLNERMDAAAQKHFDKWGCWFNRDILAVVQEAGLEIESSSRWHFGTSYLIVARPPAGSQPT